VVVLATKPLPAQVPPEPAAFSVCSQTAKSILFNQLKASAPSASFGREVHSLTEHCTKISRSPYYCCSLVLTLIRVSILKPSGYESKGDERLHGWQRGPQHAGFLMVRNPWDSGFRLEWTTEVAGRSCLWKHCLEYLISTNFSWINFTSRYFPEQF